METNLLEEQYRKNVIEAEFKKINFTIYNFIEDDGWVCELNNQYDDVYDVDDFEYVSLSISDDIAKKIKEGDKSVIGYYNGFKHYVEKVLQKKYNIPKMGVFIMKDLGVVVVVKLKDFNIFQ